MKPEDDVIGLADFESALIRLKGALAQPKNEWLRDACIQRFEFTIELAWKSIARLARHDGFECVSARQAFRAAFKLGWIEDDMAWVTMVEDRNLTSHTYNEGLAEELYARLPRHAEKLTDLLKRLKQVLSPPQAK